MAIVCQQCGDVGYTDLLIYCCLCHEVARHQYCLDTIPKLDEDLEWSCVDCNFRTTKVECVNGQHLELSDNDGHLSNKEKSNSNKNRLGNDLHAHDHEIMAWGSTKRRSVNAHNHEIMAWGNTKRRSINVNEHAIKAWGNTKKRSIRSIKNTLEAYDDSLIDDLTPRSFECSKPSNGKRKLNFLDEGDEMMDNNGRRKLILSDADDESRDNCQHLNGFKRKLILPDEHDISRCDFPQPNGVRRKFILPQEDDELSDDSTLEIKINILRKRISLDPSFDNNKYNGDMHKLAILSKEGEDVVAKSLKETQVSSNSNKMRYFEVESILQDIDVEMTTKASSKDGLVQSSNGIVHLQHSIRSRSEFNYILAMPISWRGWFKISGRAYGPLIARLSPNACEKAWNAAKFLPRVIQLTMVSRSHAWPRSFKTSPPTDDHVALAFFPPDSRVEKMVDQLVQEVIRCDLMLKVALDVAELLIFPSNLLPENYKRYQGKHYLWGVFKGKDSEKISGETRIAQTDENSGKQTVLNSSIKSEEEKIERDDREATLEGDKLEENLCSVPNERRDTEIGTGSVMAELNGCLELFPTQVENIALRLKTGDGKLGVDLELSLGLPFRR